MCLLVQRISYMYMHIQYPCNTHLTRPLFNIGLAHAVIAYTVHGHEDSHMRPYKFVYKCDV